MHFKEGNYYLKTPSIEVCDNKADKQQTYAVNLSYHLISFLDPRDLDRRASRHDDVFLLRTRDLVQ